MAFYCGDDRRGKKRVAKGAQDFYQFNEAKILDAAMVVVFAARTDITEEFLTHVLEKENNDGRFALPEHKAQQHGARTIFANMHKFNFKDTIHWNEKQVYLNVGHFLLGTAGMGLDTLTMEGIDFKVLDKEFNLNEKGFTSAVVVSVGYHKDTDFNASLPKSRLDKSEIIERI